MSNTTSAITSPPHIIERVVAVLGQIDLDPCSNSHETPTVPAVRHYTVDDDGLAQPWSGAVYMCPPYGRAIGAWVEKLCQEYEAGAVREAIALLPGRTETRWFRRLRDYHFCAVRGRLRFMGGASSAPFPSAVFYLGPRPTAFAKEMETIGTVFVRRRVAAAGRPEGSPGAGEGRE